jgi:hypothetical protein
MNEADLADVVRRVVGTWPMAPKGYLWTEAIADLDYGPALAAYYRLRDEHDEQRISIARFKATVRALTNDSTSRQHPNEPAPDGPAVSFAEYLARTQWRAGTGDPDAVVALDEWDRAQLVLDRLHERAEHQP